MWAKTPHKQWNYSDLNNPNINTMIIEECSPDDFYSKATSIQANVLQPSNNSNNKPAQLFSIAVEVLKYHLVFNFLFTGRAKSSVELHQNFNLRFKTAEKATITFGAVLDDQGHPFLGLEILYSDKVDIRMKKMELVAKKVDDIGPSQYDLSKNEQLRLGFPIPEDSQVQKTEMPETTSSSDISVMVDNLTQWTAGTARQIKKVELLKYELDQELSLAKRFLQQAADLATDEPTSSGAGNSKRKRIMS